MVNIKDINYLVYTLFLLIINIQILGDFFTYKELNKKWLVISSIISYCFSVFIGRSLSVPVVVFSLNMFFMCIISMAFVGSLGKKILVSSVIMVINTAGNIITYMLLVPAGNIIAYMLRVPGGFMYLNEPFWGTFIIVSICEKIINRIYRDKEISQIMPYQGMVLIVIPLCSLGILYSAEGNGYDKNLTSVITVCVLIINVAISYFYQILEENYLRKIRNVELEEQIRAYSNELNIITESQNKVKSLKHDMHHHLIEIEGLVNHHKLDEVKSYLNQIKTALDNQSEYVSSGNMEIDSLLNYLLQKAHDKLEKVDVEIAIPENIDINTFKLNVILGNLIENAIQASEESENKIFSIVIKEDKGVLFLTIKNSYKAVMKEGNTFITTKSDKTSHGIGLKNAERIITEADGNMDVIVEDDLFIVNVILYIDRLN